MSYGSYLVRVFDSAEVTPSLLEWGRSCFKGLPSGVYTLSHLTDVRLAGGSGIEGTFVCGASYDNTFRVGLYTVGDDVVVRLFIGEELVGMVRGLASTLWASGSGVLSRDFPELLSAVASAPTLHDVYLAFAGYVSGAPRLGVFMWLHSMAPVESADSVHPGDSYYLDGDARSLVMVTAVEGLLCEIGDVSAGLESSGDWVPYYRLWSSL